ncbi:MAG: hypothetical protein GX456_10030 [Verrucomicrobia bacterium]|nr:hypothetical protein [Verrucomicrobiota bacterium]
MFRAFHGSEAYHAVPIVPPKGGTLTAAGVTSPEVRNDPSLPESGVYAEHSQSTEQCSCLVS